MFSRQCNVPRWAFPEPVYKGYFIITWKLMRVLVFLVLPSWGADRAFPLHLIWLLKDENLFILVSDSPQGHTKSSCGNQGNGTEGNTEEALFRTYLFILGEVKPAFGGWDLQLCCCLWVRAGRQSRWKGELSKECLVNPVRDSLLHSPLLLRRMRLVVVAVNQLPCISLCRGTRDSFVTQIHLPCASSAALLTLAAPPAFCAGFETKENVSVAEEGLRDVIFVRYFYEVAHLWDRYLQRTQLNKSDLKSILWSTCSTLKSVKQIKIMNQDHLCF